MDGQWRTECVEEKASQSQEGPIHAKRDEWIATEAVEIEQPESD